MRRRAHIEFLGHTSVQVTTFAHQKIFDLGKLKQDGVQVDLVTLKKLKPSERPPFRFGCSIGDGTLGNPFNVSVTAKTAESEESVIAQLTIYDGKEKTLEVDLPN
ncbi:MAG: hypothetical protein WC523_04225 [Patescibacteria group bacterium]